MGGIVMSSPRIETYVSQDRSIGANSDGLPSPPVHDGSACHKTWLISGGRSGNGGGKQLTVHGSDSDLQNVIPSNAACVRTQTAQCSEAERGDAEASTKTQSDFTASIAHEIMQPLSAVVISAEAASCWLDTERPNVSRALAALQKVICDGNDVINILRELRSLYRFQPSEKCEVTMQELIDDVLSRVRSRADSLHIQIALDLSKGLPPVIGNRTQLVQMLLNLVTNAIDAMEALPDERRILRVRSTFERRMILTEVEDCGEGLVDCESIFEPGYTTKSNGMGVGLPLCRAIVDAHYGRLWASSMGANGSIFSFALPAAIAPSCAGKRERVIASRSGGSYAA